MTWGNWPKIFLHRPITQFRVLVYTVLLYWISSTNKQHPCLIWLIIYKNKKFRFYCNFCIKKPLINCSTIFLSKQKSSKILRQIIQDYTINLIVIFMILTNEISFTGNRRLKTLFRHYYKRLKVLCWIPKNCKRVSIMLS